MQSNNEILYVERDSNGCGVYFADKHKEIYAMSILKYMKHINNNQNPIKLSHKLYHSPLKVGDYLFSPTMNTKDSECEYFNLLKIDEKNEYFEQLLEERKLLNKAKERFLEHKRREVYNEY